MYLRGNLIGTDDDDGRRRRTTKTMTTTTTTITHFKSFIDRKSGPDNRFFSKRVFQICDTHYIFKLDFIYNPDNT